MNESLSHAFTSKRKHEIGLSFKCKILVYAGRELILCDDLSTSVALKAISVCFVLYHVEYLQIIQYH